MAGMAPYERIFLEHRILVLSTMMGHQQLQKLRFQLSLEHCLFCLHECAPPYFVVVIYHRCSTFVMISTGT